MAYEAPWHKLERALAATKLNELCASAYLGPGMSRISASMECASLFEGCRITVPAGFAYDRQNRNLPGLAVPHIRRKCHSIVMGAHSLLFAKENPIPMFTVNGGEWLEHTQAELLNKTIQEEYRSPQGRFRNLHDMDRHGGLLTLGATGSHMILPWGGSDGVWCELDDTLNMVLDVAGPFSQPLGFVRTGFYDPDWLVENRDMFESNTSEADIFGNVTNITDYEWVKNSASVLELKQYRRQVVAVSQGWRVKVGKRDGRMMGALQNGCVFYDHKFTRREMPAVPYFFERELWGDWGHSLTSIVYHLCMRINEMTHDIDQVQRKAPHRILAVDDETHKVQLAQSKGVHVIVTDTKKRDPREIGVSQYNKDAMALLGYYEQWSDSDGGTEANHATGGSGAMASSGKHEHMRASYWTERHADPARRRVDHIAVDTGRRFVWCMQDMVERGIDISRWVGPEGYKVEVSASDLCLDEARFSKSIQPISDEANSPQAKQDEAKQWFEIGKLSDTAYVAMRQHLDTTQASDDAIEDEKWVEDQIRKWMHASADEADDDGFYQSPRRWIDLEAAARKVQVALQKAESRGMGKTEPWRLEFFELFLDEVAYYMQQDSAQAQTSLKVEAPMSSVFPALGGAAPGGIQSGNQPSIGGGVPPGQRPAPSSAGSPAGLPGQVAAAVGGVPTGG